MGRLGFFFMVLISLRPGCLLAEIPVSIDLLEIHDKYYDGTTVAAINEDSYILLGVADGDDVSLDFSDAWAHFLDASPGTGKTVYVYGVALVGEDASTYTLSSPPDPPGHGQHEDYGPPQHITAGTIVDGILPEHILIEANPATVNLTEEESSVITVSFFDGQGEPVDGSEGDLSLFVTSGTLSAPDCPGGTTCEAIFVPETTGTVTITGTFNSEAIADKAVLEVTATYVFGGDEDNCWYNPGNWNGQGSPGEEVTDEIIVTSDAEADELTVTGSGSIVISGDAHLETEILTVEPGGVVTVGPQAILSVQDEMTNHEGEDGLVLQSTAAGTATLLHATPGVEATVERYISGESGDWHMLSSPVENQEIDPGFTEDGLVYGWYEPAQTWVEFGSSSVYPSWDDVNDQAETFLPHKGYLVAYHFQDKGTPTNYFTGFLNQGPHEMPLSVQSCPGDSHRGFNLLANPFPSAIDWQSSEGWSGKNNLIGGNSPQGASMWVWNPEAGNYGASNANMQGPPNNGGGPPGEDGPPGLMSGHIPAMQAFWVRAQPNADGNTLQVDDGARVASDMPWRKDENPDYPGLHLTVNMQSASWYDEVLIQFGHPCDQGGSEKMFSIRDEAPSLYTEKNDEKFTISFLTCTKEHHTVPLAFKAGREEEYTLTVNGADMFTGDVYLVDLFTGKTTRLNDDATYTFLASDSDSPDRFELHFADTGNDITDVDAPAIARPQIYFAGDILHVANPWNVNADVQVFTTRASLADSFTAKAGEVSHRPFVREPGVYLVRMQSGGLVHTVRIVSL